jgi:hypothetical protein
MITDSAMMLRTLDHSENICCCDASQLALKCSVCERYFVLACLIVCSILQGGLLPVTHTSNRLFHFQQVCVASVAGSNLDLDVLRSGDSSHYLKFS